MCASDRSNIVPDIFIPDISNIKLIPLQLLQLFIDKQITFYPTITTPAYNMTLTESSVTEK